MYKLAQKYFNFGMDLIIFQDDLIIIDSSYNYKLKQIVDEQTSKTKFSNKN